MRMICDVCESAPAILFCSADEAGLCHACDEKVHSCNKLANRHIRVGLAAPSAVPHCDICENAPAFFYCDIDGISLCLECDMIVHVGGKRTHGRYLLLRQRAEFPGDKPRNGEVNLQPPNHSEMRRECQPPKYSERESRPYCGVSTMFGNTGGDRSMDNNMIDLNSKPHRTHEQASNNHEMNVVSGTTNNETASVTPAGVRSFKGEPRD